MTITSDMPVTKKGSWFLGYRDDMDGELVEAIEGLVHARWKAVRRMATMTTDMDAIQRKSCASTAN